jgi:hypothetical protein
MLPQTFEYVLQFTIAHEGDTPFMYNNWPIKNQVRRDVTVGVGHYVETEDIAASADVRNMFRIKGTSTIPSSDDMRREFRRVYDLPRTATNLWSDYRDRSPLEMDRAEMLRDLREKMLAYWDQKQQNFSNFGAIPAQAQVALMSWNYGLRLRTAPKMCNAVRAGDYMEAAKECVISTWDPQKNDAHKRLLTNAATIMSKGLDLNTLPPSNGPFKPPLLIAGGTTPPVAPPMLLGGGWVVTTMEGTWRYFFQADGKVNWTEMATPNVMEGSGQWTTQGAQLKMTWKMSEEYWELPLKAYNQKGQVKRTNGAAFPLTAKKSN